LKTANEEVSITFAHLMTTNFVDSWGSYQSNFNALDNVKEKAEFMSILAILVADIFAIAARVSQRMEMDLHLRDNSRCKTLPNAIEGMSHVPRKSPIKRKKVSQSG
jgi:hypothetical protein